VGKTCSLVQGKVGGIQVLAGLAPSSQTVGCNKRTLKVAPAPTEAEIGGAAQKYEPLIYPDPMFMSETNHRCE